MAWYDFVFLGEHKRLNDDERDEAEGKFVQLSDGVTHYQLCNQDADQPIILVHGFSVPLYVWDPTYKFLCENGFKVVRYDLFGRGYSDRPDKKNDIALFTRQLYELIQALKINPPVTLIGLSMGGLIVSSFANRYPKLVGKIILIDPFGHKLPVPLYAKLFTLPIIGEIVFGIFGSETLLKSQAEDFFDPKEIEIYLDRYRVQMQYRGFRRSILSTIRSIIGGNFSAEFKKLGTNINDVSLIWGTEDRTVPFEQHKLFLSEIPHIKFFPVRGAGHIPHYEKSAEVNQILLGILGDHART